MTASQGLNPIWARVFPLFCRKRTPGVNTAMPCCEEMYSLDAMLSCSRRLMAFRLRLLEFRGFRSGFGQGLSRVLSVGKFAICIWGEGDKTCWRG